MKIKLLVLGFAFLGSACLAPAKNNMNRAVVADWNSVKGPTVQLFHECIGAGRANEGLRADWQQ